MSLRTWAADFARLRATDWIVIAACLGSPPLLYAAFREVRFDDAYFFFQYARNLVHGDGYTFNPGQRVFAATSPLYTAVLTAITAIAPHAIETRVIAVNSVFVALQAVFLYLLLRDRLPITALILALLALADGFVVYRYLSMDTPLYAAAVLAALWASAHRGDALAGLLMGVAILCRYDAVLLLPLHVVFSLATRGRPGLSALGLAALVVLPWLAFATFYFGSPLPHTLGAKTGIVSYPEYIFVTLASVPFWSELAVRAPLLGAALCLIATGLGLWSLRAAGQALVPLVLFAFLQRVGYAAIGAPAGQTWHLHVSNIGLATLMVLGSVGLLEQGHLGGERARRANWLAPAFGAALVAIALLITVDHKEQVRTDFWLQPRDRIYRQIAAWVTARIKPEQRMMATEVATLGYLTGHTMIDPLGLINATNDYPRTYKRRSLLALVRRYRPDVLMVDWPDHGSWLEQHSGYRLVKIFEWQNPFSTLLVANAEVLRDPSSFARLHAEALSTAKGPSIHFRGE
jgi:hypothetical protein